MSFIIGSKDTKITDRDIFEYVSKKMQEQDKKSLDSWFDEEYGEVIEGDSCKYFGYDPYNEIEQRCAVGFIMDKDIFESYGEEETDVSDEKIIEVVAMSNINWAMTSKSWMMLAVLQKIHDYHDPYDWKNIMNKMSYLFDHEGNFQYSGIEDDLNSSERDFPSNDEVTIHLEDLGTELTGLKVPSLGFANNIATLLDNQPDNYFEEKIKTGVNILNAISDKQDAESSSLLLEIVEMVNADIAKQKIKQ
jgi:hypothetical protein